LPEIVYINKALRELLDKIDNEAEFFLRRVVIPTASRYGENHHLKKSDAALLYTHFC
jgi:hypothetical protein